MEYAEIPSMFNLLQITRAIMFEESFGYEFVQNDIKQRKSGGQYNRAGFTELDSGVPNDCLILYANTPQPPGHTQKWNGKMIVEDNVRLVVLYRKN